MRILKIAIAISVVVVVVAETCDRMEKASRDKYLAAAKQVRPVDVSPDCSSVSIRRPSPPVKVDTRRMVGCWDYVLHDIAGSTNVTESESNKITGCYKITVGRGLMTAFVDFSGDLIQLDVAPDFSGTVLGISPRTSGITGDMLTAVRLKYPKATLRGTEEIILDENWILYFTDRTSPRSLILKDIKRKVVVTANGRSWEQTFDDADF